MCGDQTEYNLPNFPAVRVISSEELSFVMLFWVGHTRRFLDLVEFGRERWCTLKVVYFALQPQRNHFSGLQLGQMCRKIFEQLRPYKL